MPKALPDSVANESCSAASLLRNPGQSFLGRV
jgi:hypothetical protein